MSSRPSTARQIVTKGLLIVAVNFAVFVGILVFFEGLASTVLSLRSAIRQEIPKTAERLHTTYDPLLGWVNLPNVTIDDMYGPGLHLRTNSQSFRNDEDFAVAVPDGRIRIICSGDSFTLGYGVDNENTWCELLRAEDPRFQTVNMGQGGYGFDQAFLWYRRDGTALDHDIQLFAIITDDFRRARLRSFNGYPKPLLRTKGEEIVVTNVPVPSPSLFRPLRYLLQHSRSAELVGRVSRKLSRRSAERASHELMSATLRELKALNEARGSTLVVVYLPTIEDHSEEESDPWRAFLSELTRELEVPFVDLVADFRRLPPMEVHGLFIQPGFLDFGGAAGHYTIAGNQYVASVLDDRLQAIVRATGK